MGRLRAELYRVPHSDDRGIGVFARVSGAPADRNLIDLYADAGIEFIGLSDARTDDSSASLPVTLTSQGGPRRWMRIIAGWSIRTGQRGVSRDW